VTSGRQVAFFWGAVALLCLALAPLAPLAMPLVEAGGLACPLKAASGLPCPTCGGTRATLALATLSPGAALAANPGVALGWVALVVGGLGALGLAVADRPLPSLPTRLPIPVRLGAVALLVANWLYLVRAGI
jgi:hypothetical protein